MTAQIVDLAVVRKLRALMDDGTAMPVSAGRHGGEAMAPAWPPPAECASIVIVDPVTRARLYTLTRGMAVRDRKTKESVGIIWRFQMRPGLASGCANVVVARGLGPSRLYAPDAIEPIPFTHIDPPPAA